MQKLSDVHSTLSPGPKLHSDFFSIFFILPWMQIEPRKTLQSTLTVAQRCHIWLSEHRLWHKPRFVCLFCPCKRSNVRTQPLLGKCNCWLQGGQGSCLIVHCLSVFELASVSHVHRQLMSGKLPHDITVDVPSVDLFGWYSVLHTGDPPLVCGYAGFWGFCLMM